MNPEMKVFLASDHRSGGFGKLSLAALLVAAAVGAWYFGAEHFTSQPSVQLPAAAQTQPIKVAHADPAPAPAPAPIAKKPAAPAPLVDAHFTTDTDGFVYVDDAFRGTKGPNYASGVRAPDGAEGGGLSVRVGGIDTKSPPGGMSGGWQRTFELAAPSTLTLSFRYNMTQATEYEADEYSQVLAKINDTQLGTTADYVAQLTGDGNGGKAPTTGWQTFQKTLPALPAGTHTLAIGLYNNKKSAENEFTDLKIDDVRVVTGAAPIEMPPMPHRKPAPPLTQKPAVPETQDLTF
jgi:hypothetical protein